MIQSEQFPFFLGFLAPPISFSGSWGLFQEIIIIIIIIIIITSFTFWIYSKKKRFWSAKGQPFLRTEVYKAK